MTAQNSPLPSHLEFQGVPLRVIDYQGRPWLTAADLARALGYSRADKVTQIYERHKDEFTEEMTTTLKMRVVREGRGEADMDVRIFSSRGCYLIAMFARTPVAKAFRKWVLDVLESFERLKQDQEVLMSLVREWTREVSDRCDRLERRHEVLSQETRALQDKLDRLIEESGRIREALRRQRALEREISQNMEDLLGEIWTLKRRLARRETDGGAPSEKLVSNQRGAREVKKWVRWTPEEDALLLSLRRLGLGWVKIGMHLGRSKESVRDRYKRLISGKIRCPERSGRIVPFRLILNLGDEEE